ncbi:uncharacterized protein LOC144175363 [Haemaphysalis longicornis]
MPQGIQRQRASRKGVSFHRKPATMCFCETPFEVSLLAAVCLLWNGFKVYDVYTVYERHGGFFVLVLNIAFYGYSIIVATMLLLGAISGSKSLLGYFDIGAKIKVVLLIILLTVRIIFKPSAESGKHTSKTLALYADHRDTS